MTFDIEYGLVLFITHRIIDVRDLGYEASKVIVVDRFGDGMPPVMIEHRLKMYRAQKSTYGTIIICSCNRTALDWFGREQGYSEGYPGICVEDGGVGFVPLNRVKNPEWLARFSLGDLYDRGEFEPPFPMLAEQRNR